MAFDKKEVNVIGMHCNSCAMAVKLSMEDLDGVKEASADFETGKVQVEYDPEKVTDADLAAAVDDAGFKME